MIIEKAQAQAQATPSPAPGIFQFGANSANVSASIAPGEQPKTGGFNFSLNTAPTFNFSEQTPQQVNAYQFIIFLFQIIIFFLCFQSNVPFQFGSASEAPPNVFS